MITEDQLEQLCLSWFRDEGYEYAYGPDIAHDGDTPEHPALIRNNRVFHRHLTNGVKIEYHDGDEKKTEYVQLIDFNNPDNNRYLIVNQFTVQGTKMNRRPDLVVFINGLPLAVIELKNPADEGTDVWDAYNQITTYKDEINDLFVFNEALVVSDGLTARVGSLTANKERFMPWRTIANENDKPLLEYELEKVVKGFFNRELLLDYLRYFVLFEEESDLIIKKIAGYHQFHAVREAVRVTVIASRANEEEAVSEERAIYGKTVVPGSRKAGVVWHTQGSGKSISMVCYAGKLLQQKEMNNPTLVVVTDRTDLDGQLFQTFSRSQEFLRQTPLQVESREELRKELDSRQSGGIIFTTVQKFSLLYEEDKHPVLNERANIVVISDEAYRSQYGLKAVLDPKTGKFKFGYAKHMRDSLPNASFIGFTGTPISTDDKEAMKRHEDLGLNEDEMAFYDALANNESAVRELGDEILKKIAQELTDKLRKSTTVDWQQRESVRARLRNMVRITLRRYKYPPDKQQEAIDLVLQQAGKLSDEWSK